MEENEITRLHELEEKEERQRQQTRERGKRYNENSVDRIAFTVPKGRKKDIQAAAEKRGLSVNAFIQAVIFAAIDTE